MTLDRTTLPPDPGGMPGPDDRPSPDPLPHDEGGPAVRTPEELGRRMREGPAAGGGSPHVQPDLDEPVNPM